MLFASLLCFLGTTGLRGVNPTTFKFSLGEPATVSAGVYNARGALVRTISANESLSAGSFRRTWDGKTDWGTVAPTGSYTFKTVSHNLRIRWEGTIGNSSSDRTGVSKIRGIGGILDILSLKGSNYILRDYNEGYEWITRYDRSDPNRFYPSGQRFTGNGPSNASKYNATSFDTDGSMIYVGMTYNRYFNSSYGNNIILAFNPENQSSSAIGIFTGVKPIAGAEAGQNDSGKFIVLNPPASLTTTVPTSIAVQQSGTNLAVAMHGSDTVSFYNKSTGLRVSNIPTLSVPKPLYIKWNSDGSALYVVRDDPTLASGIEVWKLADGRWNRTQVLPTAGQVTALTVSRSTGTLAATVAGQTQQVWFFDRAGKFLKSIGKQGGFTQSPTVLADRFSFLPTVKGASPLTGGPNGVGGLAFDLEDRLWVVDKGNTRIQCFNSSDQSIQTQSFVPGQQYVMAVDINDPTRIFSGYTEYQRDYAVPLTTDSSGKNGGWKIARNWGYLKLPNGSSVGTILGRASSSYIDGISQVITSKSGPFRGRTFGILQSTNRGTYDFVELDSAKGLVYLGRFQSDRFPSLPGFSPNGKFVQSVGLPSLVEDSVGLKLMATYSDGALSIYQQRLTDIRFGFAQWAPPALYASTPHGTTGYVGPAGIGGGISLLSDGALVTANNTDVTTPGTPFVGILPAGGLAVVNEFARGAYNQPLRRDGTVPIRDANQHPAYPACGVRAARDIIAQFSHGEFIYSEQMNQILLFHKSGLPLGQTGQRLKNALKWAATSGAGGNFTSHWMNVVPDGSIVIHANSESMQGGVSEFSIKNLPSLKETNSAVQFGVENNVGNIGATGTAGATNQTGRTNVLDPTELPNYTFTFTEGFNRPNTLDVGNGWLDPYNTFQLIEGQLKVRKESFYDDFSMRTILFRGNNRYLNSRQTLRIPASFSQPQNLFTTSYATMHYVGLVGRCALDAADPQDVEDRYTVEVSYNRDNGKAASISLVIYLYRNVPGVGRQKFALATDAISNIPVYSTPHSYTLTFAVSGRAPTFLVASLVDDQNGQKIVLKAENDEPSLQFPGRVGIMARLGKNVLAGDNGKPAYELRF